MPTANSELKDPKEMTAEEKKAEEKRKEDEK